jgi:hypothetical protein
MPQSPLSRSPKKHPAHENAGIFVTIAVTIAALLFRTVPERAFREPFSFALIHNLPGVESANKHGEGHG